MNRSIETGKAPGPMSRYSQAVETPADVRMLHVSGQVGVTLSGELPESVERQNELAWDNIFAILAEAEMGKEDIVDVLAIVTDHADVAVYRDVRDRKLDGHSCASTLLVCGLADPAWKVEIAVRAAASRDNAE